MKQAGDRTITTQNTKMDTRGADSDTLAMITGRLSFNLLALLITTLIVTFGAEVHAQDFSFEASPTTIAVPRGSGIAGRITSSGGSSSGER